MRFGLIYVLGRMRIIAGKYRGRRLKGPGKKNDFTRPMLDRVRESLFSILGQRVVGRKVLDLCAGTGSIGLEAISRGAAFCTFVEKNPVNIRTIQHNIDSLGATESTKIVRAVLPQAIKRIHIKVDLVFFDPPFALDLAERTVPELLKHERLNEDAIVVIERSKLSKELDFEQLILESKRIIGDSVLWIFRYET